MNNNPFVYIVLVNWNGWKDSMECMESVLRQQYPAYRILLCDNDSTDSSVDHLVAWAEGTLPYPDADGPLAALTVPPVGKPLSCRVLDYVPDGSFPMCEERLIIIRTGGNLGFAGGNNIGIKFALAQGDCKYIWLLNNDTVIEKDTLEHLVATAENDSTIGIVGSTICYYDRPKTVQALAGASFNKFSACSQMFGIGRDLSSISAEEIKRIEQQLDWISGASMFVTSEFIKSVGLMEERYFLYFEELDWGMRAKGKFKLAYAPKAVVFHKHGGTTKESDLSDTSIYFRCRARLKFYRKFLPPYMFFCFLAMTKEAMFHIKNGKNSVPRTMWRAMVEEMASDKVCWRQHG